MSEERKKEEHAQDLTGGGAGGSSTPEARRVAEEDLAPGLKAIEAELASLSPRTDRLDRERLIFLSGQQSVCGDASGDTKGTVPFSLRENRDSPLRENRDSPRVQWGWPAAFAAMTAVAASLLVTLLVQGEPQVEIRVVKVPVEPAGNDDVTPGPDLPPSPEGRQEPSPETVSRTGLFALVGLDWAQIYDRDRIRSENSYPGMLDRVLREGVDSLRPSAPVADVEAASAPVSYRELLNGLLQNRASEEPAPSRPLMHTLFYPGANS